MKTLICLLCALATHSMAHAQTSAATSTSKGTSPMTTPLHVANTFHFEVNAPIAQAAPLFGPEGERSWAGKHWNPEFLHPLPAPGAILDTQGAVFTIQHGPYRNVWVATVFDLQGGRMQYVSFVPGIMVAVIDVRLTPVTPAKTGVEVTYTRTALEPSVNEEVLAHGAADSASGPEWLQAIEDALKSQRSKTQ